MPNQIAAWLTQPFNPNMSAARWFLFLGLLFALLWIWHEIFSTLTAIEAEV